MTGAPLYHVYILRCADDTLYCGITNDLERRLGQHNAGKGAKYTRPGRRRPVELLTATDAMPRGEALRLEYQVKQQARTAKVGFLEKHIREEIKIVESRESGTVNQKLLAALDYLLEQTVDMDLNHGIELTEGETEARNQALEAMAEARKMSACRDDEQEQAVALGFSSVEQMREHQKFLENQASHREKVRRLVKDSEGKAMIDMRGLEIEPDSDAGPSPR